MPPALALFHPPSSTRNSELATIGILARFARDMNTFTITVSDERREKLQAIASRLNISIEQVILMSIEDLLAQPETEDSEDCCSELLLNNPRFIERIAQARKSLREGKGISIEQIKAKYGI